VYSPVLTTVSVESIPGTVPSTVSMSFLSENKPSFHTVDLADFNRPARVATADFHDLRFARSSTEFHLLQRQLGSRSNF
jgi:hypothetical protein